jgi:colanic acid/amylovoran biosynthesis protein
MINVGDTAMMTVAVRRLSELWPEASIGVITDAPGRLAVACPGAVPIPASGRRLWFSEPYFGSRLHSRLPDTVAGALRRREERLRRRWPRVAGSTIRMRRRLTGKDSGELDQFLDWASSAELVVASGAGLLTDSYASRACTTLELLEMALDRGAGAAMLGQGVGPLTDSGLEAVGRTVLPRLGLIGLREGRFGKPILIRLGVSEDRILTTGDDAIELAFPGPDHQPSGAGLGVSIRVARYSGISEAELEAIGAALSDAADRHGAELVPVPVSSHVREQDAEVIARVLGRPASEIAPLASPERLIARIADCRVVITGSYHGAVFALAQGIPALGLVGSGYYAGKFGGLADQFDGGCAVVNTRERELARRLGSAIDSAWQTAPQQAQPLLSSAEHQRDLGREAYARLRGVVAGGAEPRLATVR